jgi:hypothetical protein
MPIEAAAHAVTEAVAAVLPPVATIVQPIGVAVIIAASFGDWCLSLD